jgi:hypothetical protein
VVGAILLLLWAWSNNFLGLRDRINEFGEFLRGPVRDFLVRFRDAIQMFMTSPLETLRDLIVDITTKLFTLQNNPLIGLVTGGVGAALISAPSQDSGGRGAPGAMYMIGSGAQPEAFIPDSPGTFIPNFDKLLGGMGGGDQYTIHVNMPEAALASPAAAQQAGQDFGRAIKEELRRRG